MPLLVRPVPSPFAAATAAITRTTAASCCAAATTAVAPPPAAPSPVKCTADGELFQIQESEGCASIDEEVCYAVALAALPDSSACVWARATTSRRCSATWRLFLN